jgi:tetratricopeptide (TPR) repeat protein
MLPVSADLGKAVEEAQHLLREAEVVLVSAHPQRLDFSAERAVQAIALLGGHPQAEQAEIRRLLAQAWKLRGLAEEERGTEAGCRAAVQAYDEARRIFSTALDPQQPEDQHELGSLWTHRGMALMNMGKREDVLEAEDSFSQAVAIRRKLPLEQNWMFPWCLAASLINRADALARLGSPDELAEALRSYDEALAHLERTPLEPHPHAVRQRQAVAWVNRGLSLQALQSEDGLQRSLESFEAAIRLLRQHPLQPPSQHCRTLAFALINRANGLLDSTPCQAALARQSSLEALSLLLSLEENDPVAAEAGLKARQSLCRALAWLVESEPATEAEGGEDWITEMTDTIDSALHLGRLWEDRGTAAFRPLVSSLFRLGCRVFGSRQPHFLAEFVVEHLQGDAAFAGDVEMRAAAWRGIAQSLRLIEGRCMKLVTEAGSESDIQSLDRNLKIAADLRAAAKQLSEMEQRFPEESATAAGESS